MIIKNNFQSVLTAFFLLSLTLGVGRIKAQLFPVASFIYSISPGGVVNFTSTSTNTTNLVCRWIFGDGTQTVGIESPSHTYTTNGYYAVILSIETANGVIRDSTTRAIIINDVITGQSVSLNQISANSIKILPSPAASYFDLVDAGPPKQFKTIHLSDINGKEINCNYRYNNNIYRVDTESLESGIYTVIIRAENTVVSKRVVIKK